MSVSDFSLVAIPSRDCQVSHGLWMMEHVGYLLTLDDREFLRERLPALAASNPHVEFVAHMHANRHPIAIGEYGACVVWGDQLVRRRRGCGTVPVRMRGHCLV